ncbi:MAG TPA: response regulator transcription factor [Rubrobacteraceae bacterium]|nr:response regulator transcription factor [Rubrobacteraceae bacterium]
MKNEGSSPPNRLLIADDHALVREGMRAMLASEQNLEVVGEAENGREALELCRELRPDLILMDVRMPEMDGLAATREIKGEYPETRILILTTHESPEYLMDAIRAGASGYVLKDSTKQRLLDAVRRVISGESPVNQELAMQVIQRLTDENRRHAEPLPEPAEKWREETLTEPLTDREIEILRSLALGKTNRQVAKELLISLSTVKTHVQHVSIKLGVSDRTQAAVRAAELGLLSREE